MAVIQRLEIYGLFTDVAVVVVFCASNADSPPPLDIKFRFAAKKGNHFAPRKISSRNTQPHTHTEPFFRLSFGRNERQSEPDFEDNQNRPKFYIVNKICQTGQKHTFLFEFKLAFQKTTFRTKSTLLCLSIYAKLAKVTVPFRWYHLGKILSFQILSIHKKGTKN